MKRRAWRYGGAAAALAMVVALAAPAGSQPAVEQAEARSAEYAKFPAESVAATGLANATSKLVRAHLLARDGVQGDNLTDFVPELQTRAGKVRVEVIAADPAAAAPGLRAAGLEVTGVYPQYEMVVGYLDMADLAAAGAVDGVALIRPEYGAATNVGATTSQADASIDADLLRLTDGVDGSGIEVGVLSDSFNKNSPGSTSGTGCNRTTTGTASQNSGDLPAVVGNLAPDPTTFPPFIDEGRAMMELIHDLAPGADLTFRTAFEGQADFATGIGDLVNCGADVVVDDIIYFTAPMFQDGLVAQAADAAAAAGVPYFSSAGNQGPFGADQMYRDSNNAADDGIFPPTGDDFHDWDPDPGGGQIDQFIRIQIPNGAGLRLVLQWNEPFGGSLGAGAFTDLDLYACVLPNAVSCQSASSFRSTDLQGCAANAPPEPDPVEFIAIPPGPGPRDYYIAVEHFCGPQGNTHFRLSPSGIGTSVTNLTFDPTDTGDPVFDQAQIYGHPAAADAMAVGAAFFAEIDQFGGFTGGPEINVEAFSSLGGDLPFYFDGAGNPLPNAPQTRFKPEVVAPDGTNTTFFGSDSSADPDAFPNFFGTSAAAPHAAAVAALMLEQRPGMTPAQVYERLRKTAIDIEGELQDDLSGDGLVDAFHAALLAYDHVTLDDIDNDGSREVAVLGRDPVGGNMEIVVREIDTGALVKLIDLGSSFESLDIEVVNEGPVPDLAVLQYRYSDGSTRVTVWDALSGALTANIKHGKAYVPIDMEVVPGAGADDIAVLAIETATGDKVGLVNDSATMAAVSTAVFGGPKLEVIDLETVPVPGADDIVALARNTTTGAYTSLIHKSNSGAFVKNVFFGKGLRAFEIEVALLAGDPEIIAFGPNPNGAAIAIARDSVSGGLVNIVKFGKAYIPLDLEIKVEPGTDNLVMLGRRKANDQVRTIERDGLTDALAASIAFGPLLRAVDLEIAPDTGAPNLAVLQARISDGKRFVQVRDTVTGALVKFVAV